MMSREASATSHIAPAILAGGAAAVVYALRGSGARTPITSTAS